MEFEFDPGKSIANKIKHGIDFVEAQALWLDIGYVEIPATSFVEERKALVAKYGNRYWAAIYTMRGSKIRIISVRRARDTEKWYYEDHNNR